MLTDKLVFTTLYKEKDQQRKGVNVQLQWPSLKKYISADISLAFQTCRNLPLFNSNYMYL